MKISLHRLPQSPFTQLFLALSISVYCVESTYYCGTAGGDPCTLAETLYEPYARAENCEFNSVYAPCDRYIVPGWYKSDDLVMDQCPGVNSCGTVYPIWMNGTFPLVSDGVVSRTLCMSGFADCCARQYELQIKNCGTSYVYCLPALDSCPERFCFGTNGTCEYPTTVAITTQANVISTVPLKEYKDLQKRYVVAVVAIVLLLLSMAGLAGAVSYYYIRKKKKENEIRQSRAELVTDETGVEGNGTPPHLHFKA